MYGDGQDCVIAVRKGCHGVSLGSPLAEMFQLLQGLQENSAQQNQMGLTPASRSRILRANSRQRVSSKGVSTVTGNSANGLIFMIEDTRTIAGAATTPGMPRSTARRVGFIGQASRLHSPGAPGGPHRFTTVPRGAVGSGDVLGHPAFLMLGAQLTEIPLGVNV